MPKERAEVEDFFSVDASDFQELLSLVSSQKYIKISDEIYSIEKPQHTIELHLLSSDQFQADRFQDGIRHRIKVKFKKSGKKVEITLEEKKFEDGIRYEKKHRVKDSFEKAWMHLRELPAIDAVLMKSAYKWHCVNYVQGKVFKISAELCCAIHPGNGKILPPPFFYFEVEKKSNFALDHFYCSDLYTAIQPYLKGLPYDSHNKIRQCQSRYTEGAPAVLEAKDAQSLQEFVSNTYETYQQSGYDSQFFKTCSFLERGNAQQKLSLERGSCVETEIKFQCDRPQMDYIDMIQKLVGNAWTIVKVPPRIVFDLYYDTADLALFHHQASFRYRSRRQEEGWICCFKSPFEKEELILSRNNTRSNVMDQCLLDGKNQSAAYESLISFLNKDIVDLVPQILIVQTRERYTIRPHSFYSVLEEAFTEKDKKYYLQRSEVLHIIFDRYTIYKASKLSLNDLIAYREIAFSQSPCFTQELYSAEIEANGRLDVASYASELFEKIRQAFQTGGITGTGKSKYETAMEAMLAYADKAADL